MDFDKLTLTTHEFGGEYKITYRTMPDDTAYHADTEEKIVNILQDARRIGTRLVAASVLTGKEPGQSLL
jgi:hypothetical protein